MPPSFAPHEPPAPDRGPKRLSNRSFGLLTSCALVALALLPLARGHDARWWPLPIAGALLALALAAPRLLETPHALWLRGARLINALTRPLIIGLLFYGTITPIAVLTRLFGRDALRLRLDAGASSYWIERAPRSAAHMRNQF